ncbi:ribosome silencing factor [soil metagenome]
MNTLKQLVIDALEGLKAHDLIVLDVRHLTTITDAMVICSGTSSRHVKSLADRVFKTVKENQLPILGMEGEREGEWALVDLGDIIVHIMLPNARDFYQLERLWGIRDSNGSELELAAA